MSFFSSRKEGGFTLIEIIVVIAIVGILATVVYASLGEARKKARDAQRVSDITQIQLALRLYRDVNGSYPPSGTNGSLDALSVLVPKYLPTLPNDPLNNGTTPTWAWTNQNTYYYWPNGNVGTCGPYKYTLWYRLETKTEGTAESCVRLDNNSYTTHQ